MADSGAVASVSLDRKKQIILRYNPPINFRAILLATLGHVVQNHRTFITR